MAARVVDRLAEGEEWLYEVKFDGYRALLIKNGARVQIRSRPGAKSPGQGRFVYGATVI
jgi:bifunctional non-homologous end joining protein LigD